ncbi:unnamed protein product [Peniophora sp. CBMAI 1063]|nr:unnamed protein product [Peniophora sp. CBMAI 1063]
MARSKQPARESAGGKLLLVEGCRLRKPVPPDLILKLQLDDHWEQLNQIRDLRNATRLVMRVLAMKSAEAKERPSCGE